MDIDGRKNINDIVIILNKTKMDRVIFDDYTGMYQKCKITTILPIDRFPPCCFLI